MIQAQMVDTARMDRLSDLRLFVDAAALGSFSAAGRKQGLSAAASSACIQRLESNLGVKLFERTTRRLRLTDEGEAYRHYGQQALDALAEAQQMLQAGQTQVRGPLRLSVPSDIGRNTLLTHLSTFQRQHPNVQVVLSLDDTPVDLIGDEIDLAIRYGQPPDSRMVARLLAPSRRVVCAAPKLLESVGIPQSPADLATLPALVLANGSRAMNEWAYRTAGVRRTVKVTRTHESNDGEVIRRWAVDGFGFAYKSLLDVEKDLAAGRLVTVLDEFFTVPAPLHALYHPHGFQPPRLRLMLAHLQRAFE
jgi:DNA-binding transcriptional LysR family regulator